MSIVKMKRIRAVALAAERDGLLADLLHLGCVEVTEPEAKLSDPNWMTLMSRESSDLTDMKTKSTAVNAALETLRKYAQLSNGLFIKREDIPEEEFLRDEAMRERLKIAEEINQKTAKLSQLQTQENRLAAQRASLQPWSAMDLPLETGSTQCVKICFGVLPAGTDLAALSAEVAGAAPTAQLTEISADNEQRHLLFYCHKAEEEAAMTVLKARLFSVVTFKDINGTAAENIARIDARIKEIAQAQENLTAELAGMGQYRETLFVCADRLAQESAKQAARERLLTNGTVFFFEGWVPEKALNALSKVLNRYSCAWEVTDPTEEDAVPTKLENPAYMKCINMVTEMYSLPGYHGIDPNPLIFWFFIFFFGFMFADVGYGIIIFLISFLITRKFKPKKTIGYMFQLGQYLGITTFLCGIAIGGFFGDVITVFSENFLGLTQSELPGFLQWFTSGPLLNPLNDPMTVLVVSLCIGVVQLVFGQCVRIYMGFRDGEPLEGILDVVPWWIFFAGIGAMALGHGKGLFLAAILILVATQGRSKNSIVGKALSGVGSLYNVTSWLSDFLSYCRLMALMLATSVIASVVNLLGSLPGLVIAFFIIFAIGHTFNIGVNIIGTYVHAARLQYLEFFSKFYVDGGIPFRPLAYDTKYVDIIQEEE